MCNLFKWLFQPKKKKTPYLAYPSYLSTHFDMLVWEEINNYRGTKGLTKLTMDSSRVADIAGNHAVWLVNNILDKETFKEYGHSNAQSRFDQIQLDFPNIRIGENLSMWYMSPVSIVAAWARSEEHRETLEADYTHVAVASAGNFCVAIFTKKTINN